MADALSFGLIGCGAIGDSLAEAVTEAADAELAACVDLDRGTATDLATTFDVDDVYTDHENMLRDARPDVAIVATPSGTHADVAVDCADAGVHVLCQKPLDVAVERIDAIIDACDENAVKLGGLFNTRFMPGPQQATKLLDAGVIGDLVLANGVLPAFRDQGYYDSAAWRGTYAMDGGCLLNQAIHTVDRLIWFTGGIERVFADVDTVAHEMEAEDLAAAQLRFETGTRGSITATTATRTYPAYDRIDLYGEDGYLSVTPAEILDADFDAEPPDVEFPDANGFVIQIEDMVEAIRADREPMIPGQEARQAPDAVLAMYESASREEPVVLEEFLAESRTE